jgi:hypothetical protein
MSKTRTWPGAVAVKNPSDGVGEGVDAHEVAAMAQSRRWWAN